MFYLGKRVVREPSFDVRNPFDGALIDRVALTQMSELKQIIDTARAGAEKVRKLNAGERARILENVAARMTQNDDMAQLLCREVGKHIREARQEILRSANTLRVAATAAKTLHGETVRFDLLNDSSKIGYYQRVPVGVVLGITPFNFPCNLACHKLGPAIAAGNAIILKPATKTPLTTLKLAEFLVDAGLPVEAVTVVCAPGGEITDRLVADPGIRKISFTGSPETGEHIIQTGGLKRCTMELGSSAAVVVGEDADPELVARKVCAGAFACCGQVCISIQRVFVHERIRNAFVRALVDAAKRLQPGNPMDEKADLGCMVSAKAADRAWSWIEEAVAAGAALHCGERNHGTSMKPAVLTDVPRGCSLMTAEAFAPVVVVNTVGSVEEAIREVNDSQYGLQASIFTNDLTNAMSFIDKVDCGSVMVNETPNFRVDNMPYGGVKRSGIGREGPAFAIEEMTEMKLVIIDRKPGAA